MRVLWFSVTPSMYAENSLTHNGGGWISSLEQNIVKKSNIQLGIAFEFDNPTFRIEGDNVVYYPLCPFNKPLRRLRRLIKMRNYEDEVINSLISVINDFNPDIIQVFGSEWCYGIITKHTNVPVVIHLQGFLTPYLNALYPPNYNYGDQIFYHLSNPIKVIKQIRYIRNFKKNCRREQEILKNCNYFMGRTDWDRRISKLYSPNSKYYFCNEVLRPSFWEDDLIWKPKVREKKIIVSTISTPLYKGIDLVLKTAKLLKELTNVDFEWRIFGVKSIKFHEWKNSIVASTVNVKLCGTVSADRLKEELLDADLYMHPSYIDNSPNSVCEAQILGVPVISTNVGGISSLVDHNVTGILVPANDPFVTSSFIKEIIENSDLAKRLSFAGRKVAIERHNPQNVVDTVWDIYEDILTI